MDQSWFLLALVPPFLYAITNHTDKHLLDKYFKEGGVGTLILVSSLLSILPIPIIFWIDQTVLDVSGRNMFLLAVAGILNVAVIWFYLRALKDDEPTVVILYYHLVPVIGFGLGYIFLGEVITGRQSAAMVIILSGTFIVSFKVDDENNLRFRTSTILSMVLACTCWALETVIMKKVSLQENVWRSLFWEQSMMVLVGIVVFICIPTYRRNFLTALKVNRLAVLSLNGMNETLYILGNIVGTFASMLAPVALVLLAQPFQTFFVLFIGLILLRFRSALSFEESERPNLIQNGLAILITGVGTYLLLTPK